MVGVQQICSTLIDTEKLTRKVNKELKQLWEKKLGIDPSAPKKLKSIEGRIDNLMRSIEEGLAGTEYANSRIRQLMKEKAALERAVPGDTNPPQIDRGQIHAYLQKLAEALKGGNMKESRELARRCVEGIELAPEGPNVTIKYKTPERPSPALSQRVVARARYSPVRERIEPLFLRLWKPPRRGRHY